MLDELDHAITAALRAGNQAEFEHLANLAETRHIERDRRLRQPDALTSAAVWYARRGIAVFPLRPGEKIPYPGSRGFKDATTQFEQVDAWWAAKPASNIGLPTGLTFNVIDIDGPAGYQSYHDLIDAQILRKEQVIARVYTPRGGMHIYVPSTGDGNAAAFRPGLDYRGKGGYVVAPPSVVGDRRYDWIEPLAQLGGSA